MSRRPRQWTEADVRAASAAWACGCSVAEIARMLRRQRKTVARCLGQRTPPPVSLAQEIEAAKRERATSPLYRPGNRL